MSPSAVNPKVPQTRIETRQGSTKRQAKLSLGDDQGANIEENINGDLVVEASAKKKTNKTVNPKGTV